MTMNFDPINDGDRTEDDRLSVLVVSDRDEERVMIERIVTDAGLGSVSCTSSAAQGILASNGPDVVLLSTECSESDLLASTRRLRPDTPLLMVGDLFDVEQVVEFMRKGACDFIQMPCSEEGIVERIRIAVLSGSRERDRQQRLERLKGICRRLSESKREISTRLDEMKNDLETCKSDVSQKLDHVSVTSEFRALISQELGVEEVLRTGLEYILSKTDPTNVAAFLANSETDFSLGAYVNYDCPREAANPILDKFASTVCQHVAFEDELVRFEDVDQFIEAIGADAEVLRNNEIVAMPCCAGDECMAVLFLFREAGTPFTDELAGTLDCLRGIFGEQLATVVRVHHRIEAEWPSAPAEDQDEGSDWGFGEGPISG
jgi:DNA-binding response OmpR family regulator